MVITDNSNKPSVVPMPSGALCVAKLLTRDGAPFTIADLEGHTRLSDGDVVMVLQCVTHAGGNGLVKHRLMLLLPYGGVGEFTMYGGELEPMANQ